MIVREQDPMNAWHPRMPSPSARARERRPAAAGQRLPARLIRAFAGATEPARATCPALPVHPRACGSAGVTWRATFHRWSDPGSSARARERRTDGIAGSLTRAVHPRVRGSDGGGKRTAARILGSSARARERRVPAIGRADVVRFIRACAGATRPEHGRKCLLTVHPRVRGSDRDQIWAEAYVLGSSARARERRSLSGASNRVTAVHPRVRGSDRPCPVVPVPYHGSSARARERRRAPCPTGSTRPVHPRVRGSDRVRERVGVEVTGFIRACAGATRSSAGVAPWPAVHPRVRGSDVTVVLRSHRGHRFIRACAGAT